MKMSHQKITGLKKKLANKGVMVSFSDGANLIPCKTTGIDIFPTISKNGEIFLKFHQGWPNANIQAAKDNIAKATNLLTRWGFKVAK